MSETTTEPTPEAPAAPTPKEVAETTLGEGGQKALKAEREARKTAEDAAKALQAQLDEIKKSQMSDIERAQAEAAEAKKALGELPKQVADTLRSHLQSIHGISDDDAALYLTSDDPAVLVKQAAGIAARSTSPTTPKPDLTQGGQSVPALNSDALEQALRSKLGIN